jgi:MFS family permease
MRSRLALAAVCAAILLDALDLSITQVALPSIEDDLGLSASALQWVANAYVLTYGGFLLLGGRAADLLGRRRVFLAGLLTFGAMSLAWRAGDDRPELAALVECAREAAREHGWR